MISEKNIQKAKNLIKNSKRPVIIQAQDDKFNRKILEYGKFDVLLSPEKGHRENSLKTLNSGLNHVLAKIASKNKISIGISPDEIKKLPKKEKAERLAKIIQNIKICRKTNLYLTEKSRDNFHFLISLGASTSQAKKASSQSF